MQKLSLLIQLKIKIKEYSKNNQRITNPFNPCLSVRMNDTKNNKLQVFCGKMMYNPILFTLISNVLNKKEMKNGHFWNEKVTTSFKIFTEGILLYKCVRIFI